MGNTDGHDQESSVISGSSRIVSNPQCVEVGQLYGRRRKRLTPEMGGGGATPVVGGEKQQ